jgi:hypothetical protein
MIVAYWIVAALLSLMYLFAGSKKLLQSKEQLAPMMAWVDTIPMPVVRLIGVVEILGVLGLILPPLTGIAPVLAIVAAIGFVVLQVLAIALHASRHERHSLPMNLALILLDAAAAWLATAF